MGITYLRNSEIDKQKWDECISKSPNGLIYSTSIFLDNMSTSWDAMVMDDYLAVMPLPFRKKYFLHYVYPPAFSQQLGITSITICNEDLIYAFIEKIPKKFRYIEMNFNAANLFFLKEELNRLNYFLDLFPTYEVLYKNYSRSGIRNITKATENGVTIKENIDVNDIIKIHRNRFLDKVGVNDEDYNRLHHLLVQLKEKNQLFTLGAYERDGTLTAGSIYLVYKNRITFIFNGNTKASLDIGATHLLMDYTIRKHCTKPYILDFEGSDNPSFVRFYEQYGAIPEYYKAIKINKLFWPLSIFK